MALGRTEVRVSRLGLGAMTWSEPRFGPAQGAYGPSAGREEEERALAASVAGGVTLVDTAPMYSSGESERRVGELVRARGRDVEIATKFSPRPWQLAGSLPAGLDASLARLGVEQVALYQIRFPHPLHAIPTLMGHLAAAVRAGKARAVGVSNYSSAQLRAAHKALADEGVVLASNQVEYSLLHRKPETDGTLDACRELGVTLVAYSPLAGGRLGGKYRGDAPRASGLGRILPAYGAARIARNEPVLALCAEIGATHGRSIPEVALRWLVEDRSVLPIPGAKNAEQARTNAGALAFSLTPEERAALTTAAGKIG
jgi:aryl-alcohol dehydrogenase-like predicted oxidoreductase